jgi:hypothetical protein
MRNHQAGLTFVEVLIASSILIVLLGLITNGIQSGGSVVSTMSSRSELIEETRYAGNIIADELSKASYVYRPGITLTLPSSYKTRNPVTNDSLWSVGDQKAPILAMIQPPKNSNGGTCDVNVANQQDNCMTFVAYYPVLRTVVMANASEEDRPKNPGDSKNVWVIYEYKELLPASRFDKSGVNGAITQVPINFPVEKSGKSFILSDYIVPSGFVTLTQCSDRNQNVTGVLLLKDCNLIQTNLDYTNSVTNGEFKLSAKEEQRGKVVQTPELRFPIAPRNTATIN